MAGQPGYNADAPYQQPHTATVAKERYDNLQ